MNIGLTIMLLAVLATCHQPVTTTESTKDASLAGVWVIDSLSVPSITIPSFCNRIGKGAIFEFTENDSLKVYLEEGLKPCDRYGYKIQNGFLQVLKDDMLLLVKHRLISERQIILTSKSFFRREDNAAVDSLPHPPPLKDGITVFLSKLQ